MSAPPSEDPNSALFRIEVIRVPLANPAQAAIVSSPRIFNELVAPPTHGMSPEDRAEIDRARAAGKFIVEVQGQTLPVPRSGRRDVAGQHHARTWWHRQSYIPPIRQRCGVTCQR